MIPIDTKEKKIIFELKSVWDSMRLKKNYFTQDQTHYGEIKFIKRLKEKPARNAYNQSYELNGH